MPPDPESSSGTVLTPKDLLRYQNPIWQILEGHRKKITENGSRKYPLSFFDPDRRWLSEMPLCAAWLPLLQENIPPFSLLEIVTGHVVGADGQIARRHIFTRAPSGEIGCLTPGQFIQPQAKDLQPGDRINLLQKKANQNGGKELLTVFPDYGIAVLHGPPSQIQKVFGLQYVTS